ncbi:MAG: serine hydrolase, partial [Flavobacteriales bacterium]|nr:serine hydrolase [Flavobacteriales bacterium]
TDYLYSDMGYYLLQEVIERITGRPLDRYVEEVFHRPMGATTLGYRPLARFPLERIAPTEQEPVFRRRLVHGDVHDPGAAMMGGVAGHAGLFGSAGDLAKVMQMLVNGGVYGGRRYLSEGVIKEFTKCQFCKPDGSGNRRGLGFDRPSSEAGKGPVCDCVSYASFGHTGFTGTMAWADPESRSVYIFLSNRVHPSAEVNKLARMDIRTNVQAVVHAALAQRRSGLTVDPTAVGR